MSKTLYQLLSTLPVTRQLGKGHDEAYQALVQVNSQLGKVSDEHVVLLHLQDRDSGAVVIKVSDYLEHLQMLMDFAGFFIGRRDFVLVHPELDFGICIERFEYHNNLVVWGL
ncbi:hypothetical protein JJB07_03870 [Tumebacillus sp. ITR2]|uniref:Uncharacterized protein n=1 Tax=Tumebacillus amylolyticus TaxID=2801339 RepID=A0ABS1J677_9BACL|nr:hypothetical protein [Tumebacillus amylolyticus]MBL0385778.1 hypothetical protein [Tumebacillus amylolyticus]